jgi:hypothetical protein
MTIEYADYGWDDPNEMPLSKGGQRRVRIAELLKALSAIRLARRLDSARFTRLERELILLLDADLIATHQTRAQSS